MPPPRVAARYEARDGIQHDVIVYRTPAGRWRILDAVGEDAIIVETLTGFDDRLGQAEGLARDYAEQQQLHHDGERPDDPLPRLRPLGIEDPDESPCAA